jgi:hypothetical protein
MSPVRVDACLHHEEKRSSTHAIHCSDRRAPLDEESHRVVPILPRGDLQRRAVRCDTEVTVSPGLQCIDIHSQVKQAPHSFREPIACKLREQRTAFGEELAREKASDRSESSRR